MRLSKRGATVGSDVMVARRGRVFDPRQTILARAARLFRADGGATVPPVANDPRTTLAGPAGCPVGVGYA